jgi:hypothetical protein
VILRLAFLCEYLKGLLDGRVLVRIEIGSQISEIPIVLSAVQYHHPKAQPH